ncbi:cobalamin biosynthesis protein [Streptomyces sp. NBC_00388]|uniref:cobalamin biosynthesis protein n=1 Tax=Streptomyces sp. NBC_00388 TaxID=2975735 RepID=UPI002E21E1B7
MTAAGPGPAGDPEHAAAPPGRLVVGVGASRGVSADEVLALVSAALRDAGLSVLDVDELATVDTRAAEPGLVAAAGRLGVPLRAYPARALARIPVPHPSATALAAVGTPSVAEASALAGGGELLVPKRKSAPHGSRPARATCAVVRRAQPGPAPADPGSPPGSAANAGLPQQHHVNPDDEGQLLHHHGSHAHTH